MHRISVLSILGLMFLPSVLSAEVPHQINMQSIIYDASGNVTTSDKVDLTIRILDEGNNVVFSEPHAGVQVIEGAVNVNIGSESGGVPLEILDPETGSKIIDVQVNGTNPFEMMPLGSVPYAMWAEKAVSVADDAIESRHIKNGTIKAEDIDPLAFSDIQGQAAEGQIPGSVATDAELNAHINSGTAHPASAIVVSGNFITFVATNAQEALQKLDQKLADEIVNRQNAISTLTTNLNNEITNRQNADSTLTTNLNNEIAARGAGDTALQGQINTANTNITNLQTTTSSINNIPGTLDDGKIASTIARDSEVTNAISSHNHDGAYVNVGGDSMTGSLNVPDEGGTPLSGGNFNVGRALRNHENQIAALKGAPAAATAKAWVTWSVDGGGAITVLSSFNVSGVANGGGTDFAVTFAPSMSDPLYVMVGSGEDPSDLGGGGAMMIGMNTSKNTADTAYIKAVDKNGNKQFNNRTYRVVFFR